jgi:hypothetical protein
MVLTLAITIPLIGISAVLLYVHLVSSPPESMTVEASPSDSPVMEVAQIQTPAEPQEDEPDVNPLQPVGPKASTRVTSSASGSCSSGSCTTPSVPQSGCSGSSSCGG